MNDVLRIARLKIALQRAFLGRAILRVIEWPTLLFTARSLPQLEPHEGLLFWILCVKQ